MHHSLRIKNTLLMAVFTGLGIAIPILFHLLGLGSVFLPMFLPLAIGAFFLSPLNAFIIGFTTPLVSALLTGMPPFYPPVAFVMMAELALFCMLISTIRHRTAMPAIAIMIIAVLFDRALIWIIYSYMMPLFQIHGPAYSLYDLLKSLPGIVILLTAVPAAIPLLGKILAQQTLRPYELSENSTHGE